MTRPIAAPPRQLSLKTKNTLHCIGLVPLRCTAAGYPVTMSGPGFCIVRRRLQFWQIWEDTASLENFNNNGFSIYAPQMWILFKLNIIHNNLLYHSGLTTSWYY